MSVRIIELWGAATVQGLPLPGNRRFGVPVAGAWDQEALLISNALIGNEEVRPVIELSMASLSFSVTEPASFAVVGAPTQVLIDGIANAGNARLLASAGSMVQILTPSFGARVYVAFSGMNFKPGSTVRRGDVFEIDSKVKRPAKLDGGLNSLESDPIRVLHGPVLGKDELKAMFDREFKVSHESNRAGVRTEAAIELNMNESPSDPASPGAIQVTPSGELIFLGPDGPTIGGYPKIGFVASVDYSKLGQLRPGQVFRLRLVEKKEAVRDLQVVLESQKKRIRSILLNW